MKVDWLLKGQGIENECCGLKVKVQLVKIEEKVTERCCGEKIPNKQISSSYTDHAPS